MTIYLTKLKHILPAFLNIAFGTVFGLAFIRWLLCIQFSILDIREEFWVLWIPLLFPGIPVTLWLRQRFRILTFKNDNDRGRFFFQVIAWGAITAMLFVSQDYLTTATGKLQQLSDIKEIDRVEKSRYYKLTNFAVASYYGGSYTNFRSSGKYNESLNFDIYFVTPILPDNIQRVNGIPKHWFGVKYKEQISNRISNEEKERKYKIFLDECISKMESYRFYAIDHFERQPTSDDKTYFLKAIGARIKQPADDSFIVLAPINKPYANRNGNKFAWIFGSFGIGLAVLLFSLIWPGYSSSEHKRQLQGRKPRKDDLVEMLRFLIPQREHYATSLILDLNILVFLIMVFSGVHLLYPNGSELLQWGANRRFETTGGEWWRLFTSMFLHGGFMHLFLNIYGLLIAAIFVEPLLGRKNYLILYILSGLCGSIASIWWYENTISVGASGAIFGLYGAILGLLLTNAFPCEGKKGIFMMFGIYVGINLLVGLTGGIDNAAHLGGLFSGALIGIMLYKLDDRKIRQKESVTNAKLNS